MSLILEMEKRKAAKIRAEKLSIAEFELQVAKAAEQRLAEGSLTAWKDAVAVRKAAEVRVRQLS